LNTHILLAPIANPSNLTDLSLQKINGSNDLSPRISSDGAKIIFLNRKNDGSGINQIMTMDIDDASNRILLLEDAYFPSWR
jgi:TolB protein